MQNFFTGKFMIKLGLGLVLMANLIVTPAIGQRREVKTDSLQAPTQMAAQTVTITGKVKAVTEATLTVVDDQKAEVAISLDAKTKITKGGKAATFADLKADDAVVVVATKGEGDALTAKSITVSESSLSQILPS